MNMYMRVRSIKTFEGVNGKFEANQKSLYELSPIEH